MIPVFQEFCALIYEPALLPPNVAIPQAKSPVLKSILTTFMLGIKGQQRGWLISHTARLPPSRSTLGSGGKQQEVQSKLATEIF